MLAALRNSRLVQSAGLYTIGNVGAAGLTFLLVPVLTRMLPPEEYAHAALFSASVSLLVPLVGVSINALAFNRWYQRERIDLARLLGSAVTLVALLAAACVAAIGLSGDRVTGWTSLPPPWQLGAVMAAAAQTVVSVVIVFWQLEQRPGPYVAWQLSLAGIGAALSIALVAGGLGWRGRTLAQVLVPLAFAAFGLWLLHRRGLFRPARDPGDMRDALAFGFPLVPHNAAAAITVLANQVFVKQHVSLAEVGLYAAALQLAMAYGLVETSMNQALAPWIYERLGENTPESRRRIVQLAYGYLAALLALAAIATLATPLLVPLLGPRFAGAGRFLGWMLLANAFGGAYRPVANLLFHAERTGVLAAITCGVAAFQVALAWVVAPAHGGVGVAQVTALSALLTLLATWAASRRVVPLPWSLRPE